MTSETEVLKTNEFLRRRKLRLQQVREQSKDIAKKIRQRAKVEKLRQIVDLDSKKGKEYLHQQDKLVKRLEQLYAQGVKSVGDSHQRATEEKLNDISPEKNDLSKLRGKEAAAELRRRKQQRLDEQKKVLDRKLLARETANEISREKSSSVANKLLAKSSSSKLTEEADPVTDDANVKKSNEGTKVTRNDMATQWDFEELPNEWEPNVPALSLPRDDKESVKDTNNPVESKSDKSKRLDLFALSAEMPSSLRGGMPSIPEDRTSIRPSLTLVSEYLQSRVLRLRETDTTSSSKKQTDDLQSIKQTILRSRSSKIEAKGNVDKSAVSSAVDTNLSKKNSVTMYNHSTRDSRDIPCGESRFVVRDHQADEDAYSQALKENNNVTKDKEHQKKLEAMRNKMAITKQTVEKEYVDTMSFLKSLPKEKCTKPMQNAYMDERRQRILKVGRQQKLQQEFNKIEKECRKHCENEKPKHTSSHKHRKKSKSPAKADFDEDFESRDIQYSWMPVPESDGNLAIHTIPTTLKEGKTGNSVKFSKVDSYHEYRSRHKHTPPTKDTNNDKQPKRVVETVIIQKGEEESTDCSTITSDTSSVENLNLGNNNKAPDQDTSEADRIIIYKILDKKEKERKKLKLIDNVAKVLKSMDKEKHKVVSDDNNNKADKGSHKRVDQNTDSRIPIDQIDEGVYKVVSEKGDNIASLYFSDNNRNRREGRKNITTDDPHEQKCCCSKNKQQTDTKGANLHRENEEPSEIRTCNPLDCKCECSNTPRSTEERPINPTSQPSAATSTSSFKTATTDKAHGALPDGGYIKLVDDDGQEAGKFYIGASGFLRDNAYEVVIQLRKKGSAKTDNDKENIKLNTTNAIEKETDIAVHDSANRATSNTHKPEPTSAANKPGTSEKQDILHLHKEAALGPSQVPSLHGCTIDDNTTQDKPGLEQNFSGGNMSTSSDEPVRKRGSAKEFVDKGVHTSFRLSYAIPRDVPKVDNVPRPATSTYTQTTVDSPNPRPVFIHMSSSTSTAYMSPPEMVLPNFMRYDHDFPGERLKMTDRYHRCGNDKCSRKRCKYYKPSSCKRSYNPNRISNPPPNTARGTEENSDMSESKFEWPIRKTESKEYKCERRTGSQQDIQHEHNTKVKKNNVPLRKLTPRNLVMRVGSSTASSFRSKMGNAYSNKIMKKTELNPVVKKYVNKLLDLNREGIKAIEVANQECSSVSTPGSSIIEVPHNLNDKRTNIDNKISLEQMKNILKEKILQECIKETNNSFQTLGTSHKSKMNKIPKKRSIHKVKSLNISKRLFKTDNSTNTKCPNRNIKSNPSTSSPSSTRENRGSKPEAISNKTKTRSKSSPTPRQHDNYKPMRNLAAENTAEDELKNTNKNIMIKSNSNKSSNNKRHQIDVASNANTFSLPFHKATSSPDSELDILNRHQQGDAAMNTSTQTSQDLDSEINLIKLAENKLQNMEKIADLTEKCTKRLSNLAKVLEEVRKNKTLAYSQISTSDTASDSEHKTDKVVNSNKTTKDVQSPAIDAHDNVTTQVTQGVASSYGSIIDAEKTTSMLSTDISNEQEKDGKRSESSEYVPFLTDIPKPTEFKYPVVQKPIDTAKLNPLPNPTIESAVGRRREKPPPALSRIHLKHGQDVVPHELSTVVEVDSPMSVKMKNQSSANTKPEIADSSYKINTGYERQKETDNNTFASINVDQMVNPDLLQTNMSVTNKQNKILSSGSSDDTKMQMMDLKQFNELMLKPFISIHEFAKQCGDIGILDDGSNLDEAPKDDGINDELSSLHSDGSLPDVIAELLKRNIITEPFKFDTVSNVNSTTVSSESTLSVLALSKIKKDKKKSSVAFQNKGHTSETSDSLSISSNPDLENAFKKLGMGWASSTLKKTKERLALSSSSNTSSSSLSQFKLKGLNEQDVPVLVTDSVLSSTKLSSKNQQDKKSSDISKNAEQQTSFMNSMTVKEFLTNELAKKITFTNKSNRNDTEEEFVSLFETKMPDEMKHLSQSVREDRTNESLPSAQNNRARTSTPVQIFKSMTYHSSSSSNMSNGLFSNADDLSSVKVTSNSNRNHSTSDKDDLTIPNCSLKMRKGNSDCSKSE